MLSSKNQTQQVILKIPPLTEIMGGGAKISSILVRGRGEGGGKNRITS